MNCNLFKFFNYGFFFVNFINVSRFHLAALPRNLQLSKHFVPAQSYSLKRVQQSVCRISQVFKLRGSHYIRRE